jgi:hypothetical protein
LRKDRFSFFAFDLRTVAVEGGVTPSL